jgi:DNA topoisomerase-1
MSKKLLIVESPGKIKKIQSYLGSDFIVTASRGHIMDLESSGLALDPNNNFEPTYTIYKDKKSVVSDIKKSCASCSQVYLAADEDREGEFIAESLKRVLKLKDSDYSRAVFHEITKEAILNAIKTPRKINDNLVHAQQTRRFLDRIVGYKLSPLLSKIPDLASDVNRYKLGAGRVQSVIVKIIVDKENEIKDFLDSSRSAFYEGKGEFIINLEDGVKFNLNTVLYTTNPIKKFELVKDSEQVYDKVIEIMEKLRQAQWKLIEIKKRNISRSPTAPFITSSLQREASTKLHWPIAKTMQVAQKLYEGGHITYMRTDCTVLSEEAHKKIKEFVTKAYGQEYYTHKQYSSKSANAQEAHEAIRPTDFTKLKISEDEDDVSDADKLYKLIWKKTVSSQMSKAQIESTQLFLAPISKTKLEEFLMVGSVSRIVFDGYLKLYKDIDEDEPLLNITIPEDLSKVKATPLIIKIKESLTSPPSRYNESSLVEALEKLGIGRPSTYATMVAKIQTKDFVRVENVPGKEKLLKELVYDCETKKLQVLDTKMFLGKENKRMVPTNIGMISTKFLITNFPQIMDIGFTAGMETLLDEISNGTKNWITVLKSYYDIITGQIQGFLQVIPIIPNQVPNTNTELVSDAQHKMVVYVNNNLVGIHPETNQEIIFTKTKYGFAIKMFSPEAGKDIWANAKEKPTLDQAIELFKVKLHPELAPETAPAKSSVIKVIGQYQIKSGPYGPYIQTGLGPKNIKFYKITGGIAPEDITSEDCKRICGSKTTKKVTKSETETESVAPVTSTKKTTKKVTNTETESVAQVTSTKKTTKKVTKTNEI